MNGEMPGAAAVLQPVLNQPAERRLATVTTRLGGEVASLLAKPGIGQSRVGALLHAQISDYCEAQPLLRMLPAGGN